ncbi:MAG: long-chain fatty acid--CoA ligase [Candidatus Omnitrophica bacterium]|nr:long-chain fatty acid--CoA ligase [Candidatus Omnitrophota bacterium]
MITQEKINNLVQLLDSASASFPKRTALIFGSKQINYRHLYHSTQRLSQALYEIGIRKKDKVAIWLPNCREFIYSFFAVLRLGAIVVPINNMLKREETRYILEDSQAKVLICSIDKLEDSKNLLSRISTLYHLICSPLPKGENQALNFSKLIQESQDLKVAVEINEGDLAQIVYTSGTTGKPKGVCLSHKNIVANVKACAKAIHFSKKDCLICILPLFHSFASTVCMCLPIYKGARIVIMRSVRPFKRIVRAIFRNRVTIFIGVPSIFSILSEMKISAWQWLLNSMINPIRLSISGAAALPGSVWQRFEKKFRRPLLQGYGLTEASPVVSLNPLKGLRKPDSIGLPIDKVFIKVVTKDGREAEVDEVGELLVKGPNVMQGYYKLDAQTYEVLKDGWLYTGDLAKKDEDGYLYIIGRSKEMINVRGFNVYPREIEDLLYQYPKINEAAVVGAEHKHRGEVPVAFVVGSKDLVQSEIIKYLRANLASYKVPLKVIFKDSLPKNATGKILKLQLQQEIKGIFG